MRHLQQREWSVCVMKLSFVVTEYLKANLQVEYTVQLAAQAKEQKKCLYNITINYRNPCTINFYNSIEMAGLSSPKVSSVLRNFEVSETRPCTLPIIKT